MTVTLLALDGSLWECEAKYDPGVILVHKEQEAVYETSKPKELGE